MEFPLHAKSYALARLDREGTSQRLIDSRRTGKDAFSPVLIATDILWLSVVSRMVFPIISCIS